MKGFLIINSWNTILNKIPIFILQIDETKLFPVKFRYKGKGYTNLFFTARMSKIEII